MLFSQEKLVICMHLFIVLVWHKCLHMVERNFHVAFFCLLVEFHSLLVVVNSIDEAWVDQERMGHLSHEVREGLLVHVILSSYCFLRLTAHRK